MSQEDVKELLESLEANDCLHSEWNWRNDYDLEWIASLIKNIQNKKK